MVTDALGRQIKVILLRGPAVVRLDAASLSSGVYNYSLVIDVQVVQTNKMTVVR